MSSGLPAPSVPLKCFGSIASPRHLSKYGSLMACGCTQKAGEERVQAHRHERQPHLACNNRGSHGLAVARRPMEEESPTWGHSRFFQAESSPVLLHKAQKQSANFNAQHDVMQALLSVAALKNVSEISTRLRDVHDRACSPGRSYIHVGDDRTQVLRYARVPSRALRSRQLKRGLTEPVVVGPVPTDVLPIVVCTSWVLGEVVRRPVVVVTPVVTARPGSTAPSYGQPKTVER